MHEFCRHLSMRVFRRHTNMRGNLSGTCLTMERFNSVDDRGIARMSTMLDDLKAGIVWTEQGTWHVSMSYALVIRSTCVRDRNCRSYIAERPWQPWRDKWERIRNRRAVVVHTTMKVTSSLRDNWWKSSLNNGILQIWILMQRTSETQWCQTWQMQTAWQVVVTNCN